MLARTSRHWTRLTVIIDVSVSLGRPILSRSCSCIVKGEVGEKGRRTELVWSPDDRVLSVGRSLTPTSGS